MGTDKHTLEHTGNKERTSSNLDVATLKKRTKFRYKRYLYHVLCVCEDNDTTLIIVKYYVKYRKWWHYEIMKADRFEELVGDGRITKNR